MRSTGRTSPAVNSARAAIGKFQVALAFMQPQLGEGDGARSGARPAATRNGALTRSIEMGPSCTASTSFAISIGLRARTSIG